MASESRCYLYNMEQQQKQQVTGYPTYSVRGFLDTEFVFSTKEELRMWMDGAKHALYTFAHWHDGTMYVGSSGKTFRGAVEELHRNYKEATGEDYEAY